MKRSIFTCLFLLPVYLTAAAHGAIVFTQETGQSVKMTVTQDIVIPLTVNDGWFGSSFIWFILEDAYSVPQATSNLGYPETSHADPGAITIEIHRGSDVTLASYEWFGVFAGNEGLIDPNDFYLGVMKLGTVPRTILLGDTIVFKSGSILLHPSVPLPDRQIGSIQAVGPTGEAQSALITVPEVSAGLLGLFGALAVLCPRRRR